MALADEQGRFGRLEAKDTLPFPGRRSQCAVATWPLARRSPPQTQRDPSVEDLPGFRGRRAVPPTKQQPPAWSYSQLFTTCRDIPRAAALSDCWPLNLQKLMNRARTTITYPVPAMRVLLIGAFVVFICLALPRRLFVKLARGFKLARKLHSIPMDDDTPEWKGWRRNQNGTYTPISCETIEEVNARSPDWLKNRILVRGVTLAITPADEAAPTGRRLLAKLLDLQARHPHCPGPQSRADRHHTGV